MQIVDTVDIVNGDTLFFHLLTVVGHIIPHMPQLLHKSLVLQLT